MNPERNFVFFPQDRHRKNKLGNDDRQIKKKKKIHWKSELTLKDKKKHARKNISQILWAAHAFSFHSFKSSYF